MYLFIYFNFSSGPGGGMDFAGVVASVAGGNVQDEILKAKEREVCQ